MLSRGGRGQDQVANGLDSRGGRKVVRKENLRISLKYNRVMNDADTTQILQALVNKIFKVNLFQKITALVHTLPSKNHYTLTLLSCRMKRISLSLSFEQRNKLYKEIIESALIFVLFQLNVIERIKNNLHIFHLVFIQQL